MIVSEDFEESQESLVIELRTEMEKQIEQRKKEIEKGNNNYNNSINNYTSCTMIHLIDIAQTHA